MNDWMEARGNVGMGLGCWFIRKPLLHFDLSMSRAGCVLCGEVFRVQGPRMKQMSGVGLGAQRGKAGGLGIWRALFVRVCGEHQALR